jgi:hypothetical protein
MSLREQGECNDWRYLPLALMVAIACNTSPQPVTERQVTLEPRPASPSPGPPTTIRLVLQLQQDGTFRVVSAAPRRGELPAEPSVAESRQALVDGRAKLIEYRAQATSGEVLATGRFVVPLVAESEFQDPNAANRIRHAEERLTTPTVKVSLPYRESIASVSFESLEPIPGAELNAWNRSAMGNVSLSLQPSQDQSPP